MPSVVLNGDLAIVDNPVPGTPDATAGGFSAQDLRAMVQDGSNAPGPCTFNSFTPSVSSGTTVQTTTGSIKVRSPIDGSLYRAQQIGTPASLTLTAPSTHQRVDRLIVRVYDQSIDSSAQYQATLETVVGSEDGTATLDNLAGAANIHSALTGATAFCHVADILITTGGATTIRDRRPFGQWGMVPPVGVNSGGVGLRQSVMVPAAGLNTKLWQMSSASATNQAAALMYLPTRGAYTKVRWQYEVDSAVAGGNFCIAIYDASGYMLANTGTINFWTGGTGSDPTTRIAATLTTLPYSGYIWDIGYYYVFMGVSSGFSGSSTVRGLSVAVGQPSGAESSYPQMVSSLNLAFGSPSGGTGTIPTFLQASGTTFVDMANASTATEFPIVPVISLST